MGRVSRVEIHQANATLMVQASLCRVQKTIKEGTQWVGAGGRTTGTADSIMQGLEKVPPDPGACYHQ